MKYTYAYKTSDGVRHEATISAASREEVFALLRTQGIKAIKVVAADGSKANGELRGVRKRIVFISLVIVSILVSLTTWFLASYQTRPQSVEMPQAKKILIAKPLPRQEINGDRSRIDQAIESLDDSVEKFLSNYAEPGRPIRVIKSKLPTDAEFVNSLNVNTRYAENEFTESIDLKRIIAGIKKEMLEFLRGGGTVNNYIDELNKRQQLEIEYRDKALDTLNKSLRKAPSDAYSYWLKVNAALESMGIYPIPLPLSLREHQLKHGIVD